ncbi:MAG: hypothetical protein ACYCSO_06205 [Cuniculiplasma sp.]
MGEIYHEIKVNGNRSKAKINAFLDTGSTYNVVGYQLSDGRHTFDIGGEIYNEKGAEIFIPNTVEKQTFGTITFKSNEIAGITINDPRFTTFTLMKIPDEAIIGHPLMQYLGMVLNLREDKATITKF